jgi:hypothetical protein
MLFQPDRRPGNRYDEAHTDGEEHGTKHVRESGPEL